ncbi:GNAT family N-acetyltransferase [Fibrella aquatica]|jgi:diamine N-acetyltransferase|uniref:GNAT family N-acetyltransferase n=1 Tax=Fibrella aquatica TaxID=3242487 RepID=UPI00352134BE
MTIRQATLSDLETLVSVARKSIYDAFSPEKYPGNPVQQYLDEAVTIPHYQQEFTDRRATFWLAENEQGVAIGFLKLRHHAPPRRMPVRHALEIVRLYLLDDYTGRGYGRQLMQYALDYARQQGYQAVWLGVWEHNAPALVFYKKMGFTRFGWHVFTFGGERQRDLWLWKAL